MARILVCDDEVPIQKLLRATLAYAGYDVEIAADGAAGLRSALRSPPDLIVTDLVMPELDGFGLAAAVRGDPRLAATPIVLLTASEQRGELELARRHGIDEVIRKPFDRSALLGAIERLLAGHRKGSADGR